MNVTAMLETPEALSRKKPNPVLGLAGVIYGAEVVGGFVVVAIDPAGTKARRFRLSRKTLERVIRELGPETEAWRGQPVYLGDVDRLDRAEVSL
jgi:hypothetical protein